MKDYIVHNEWKIIEEGFHPEYNRISESIFSIGNGNTGQRANFEESYSGDSLKGNYVAGVYYPDKTIVGWWKNGYPDYFAKILNAADWTCILIEIDGEVLDLSTARVEEFHRELDMQTSLLSRSFIAEAPSGKRVEVVAKRFLSIKRKEIGAIRYQLKSLNFSAPLKITSLIDGDVKNEDSNYDEKFWVETAYKLEEDSAFLCMKTKKTDFYVTHGIATQLYRNGAKMAAHQSSFHREKYVGHVFEFELECGEEITIEKYVAINSSLYLEREQLVHQSMIQVREAVTVGFDSLYEEHAGIWMTKWETADIRIKGDVAAQQGIRFNIFQLMQTYTGEDERLNIGPKGFTGEKYGGVTYWDTEAYCLPFFLGTSPERVSRNSLIYRHKHLLKAIENAKKLGFSGGAALYPMVTINGEECHNEWEITFEEIHRNGAIAYAIYNYINYTGDKDYLAPYGFEVLLGISRFWSQRINWSENKKAYVMLGVTGPNEYENNVNNNFHTNNMAVWTLTYTLKAIEYLKSNHAALFDELAKKWNFDEAKETDRWKSVVEKMYFPYDDERQIYLQQDGFLDKDIIPAARINPSERPIHQHWSWDRILRSCYIKQADTLQSFYWFQENYDRETLRRHFDFYEALTVHESSLSSCIHAILAALLGRTEKAYELYLRTARLDLDDYNSDTRDGLHITSMGGTWMTFVEAFGGMRVIDGKLNLNPFLPASWEEYTFRINFRKSHLEIEMKDKLTVSNHNAGAVILRIWGKEYLLEGNQSLTVKKS